MHGNVDRLSAGAQGVSTGHVRFEELTVRFGTFLAVERFSLDIPAGSFVALLGPSGCGKSTVLNALAGFQSPDHGTVALDGRQICGPGPERGVVFQQPWLFPWMTVRENVAYGPRMRGASRAQASARADELLKVVGLTAAGDRYPQMLSGGMQQRTAIARVLANDPAVLLMDEPFAALDAQTRSMMQAYVLDVWSRIGKTIVFVTHDIDEALLLSDRVVVMGTRPGRIVADLVNPLARPRTEDCAFDAQYLHLKRHCMEIIKTETLKSF